MSCRRPARAALFATLLLAASQVFAADEAKQAAAVFYRAYGELRNHGGLTGIPNEAQLKQLAPLLTPELRTMLSAALREQQRCVRQFPDDKPPWIEGDIFSSSFEGFTGVIARASKPLLRGRSVALRFTYAEGQHSVRWTDTLILVNDSGKWLVQDIYYHAKFAFASGFGSNLQASLKSIPAC
jgi:hypothetical protein